MANIKAKKQERSFYSIAKDLHVSRQSVGSWYKGKTQPRAKHLEQLSILLGKSIEELLIDFKTK